MAHFVPDVRRAVRWDGGWPHPDWDWLREQIAMLSHTAQHEVRCSMELQWLGILRGHLGGAYAVRESANVFLLSDLPYLEARELVEQIEADLKRMSSILGERAESNFVGRHIVLLFSEEDDYRGYAKHFSVDERSASDCGICVYGGEVHVAAQGKADRSVLAGLLALDLLCFQRMYPWVRHGVAEWLRSQVLSGPALESSEARALSEYWRARGLDAFWSGAAFDLEEEGAPARRLAGLIVGAMKRDQGKDFDSFAYGHGGPDGGEGACRALYGRSLADLIAELLGPGDWRVPEGWRGRLDYEED